LVKEKITPYQEQALSMKVEDGRTYVRFASPIWEEIREVHPKSALLHLTREANYSEHCPIQLLGDLDVPVGKEKSSMRKTLLYDVFWDKLPDIVPPSLSPRTVMKDGVETWINPYLVNASILAESRVRNPFFAFKYAIWYVAKHHWDTAKRLNRMPFPQPLSLHEALNGCPALGVKGINLRTSAGHLFPGVKDKYVFGLPGALQVSSDVIATMAFILDEIDRGVTPVQLIKWSLKGNEMIKRTKDDIGRARVFTVTSIAIQILGIIYLGGIAAWYKEHRDVFACKQGMNASSPEWDINAQRHLLYEVHIDKDFECLDKSIEQVVAAFEGAGFNCERAGWIARDINRVRCLGAMTQCHAMLVGKTVCMVDISDPSGGIQTTWTNSFYEETQEVVVWSLCAVDKLNAMSTSAAHSRLQYHIDDHIELVLQRWPFYELATLSNYGDDNIVSTSKAIVEEFYSEIAVYDAFCSVGWKVTDAADKGSKPKFKYRLEDLSFLKRGFRFDAVLGWVAPLDERSIWKALCWYSPGEVSDIDRAQVLLRESQRHAFLHGREKFKAMQLELRKALPYVQYEELSYDNLEIDYKLCYEEGKPFTELAT